MLASYGYDDLGRRTSLTRGNGTVTRYSYTSLSQLQTLTHDVAGGAHDVHSTYSYNPAGQINSRTTSNDAYVWTGLVNVDRSYGVNGLNQLTLSGGVPLGYDARGNLTSSGSASYSYGPENLLAATNGGLSFYYDGVGRLVEYNSSVSTRFFYDGNQMAAEVANPGGGILRRYVWGVGVDEALVWYEGNGTGDKRDDGRPVPRTGLGSMRCFPPSSLHADERGSVVAVSDASGAVQNINSYDEYGIPGAGNVGRFQYTRAHEPCRGHGEARSQAWLPELGMYYYKARIYSPTLGRFLQTDPIGYGDGLNWYNYVGGDPVNATDPSGLKCLDGTLSDDWAICKDHGGFDPNVTVRGKIDNGGWGGYFLGLFRSGPVDDSGTLFGGGGVGAPQRGQCASPGTSSSEAAAARGGNRDAYWSSRLRRGDPLAATALGIVRSNTALGVAANTRLISAIVHRNGANPGRDAINREVNQIGIEIMQAHVAAVNQFGSPTSEQVAQYHFDIFRAHGLPASTFGGAPLTGSQTEAGLTSGIWMGGC